MSTEEARKYLAESAKKSNSEFVAVKRESLIEAYGAPRPKKGKQSARGTDDVQG